MTLYTSKVIAQWLCLTERRVRQLRDEGVIVEARPGLYELQPTVARYIKYLGGAGKESLNTERMKLTAEKRKAAEMDNDLRRGDLHSTQDIEKGIQTMCLNIRSRFLAMPAKLFPPEVLFKQFTTSYSAARGALNEFWRTCSMQRDWFTDDFCQPIYEEWFAEAVARGRIAAPGFFADPAIRKAYTACAWNGPARTNLNPVQEVDAAVKRVDAGFSTAQEETATMTGGDYNRNIRQRVIEAKRKREVDEITNPQAKPPGGQQEE